MLADSEIYKQICHCTTLMYFLMVSYIFLNYFLISSFLQISPKVSLRFLSWQISQGLYDSSEKCVYVDITIMKNNSHVTRVWNVNVVFRFNVLSQHLFISGLVLTSPAHYSSPGLKQLMSYVQDSTLSKQSLIRRSKQWMNILKKVNVLTVVKQLIVKKKEITHVVPFQTDIRISN